MNNSNQDKVNGNVNSAIGQLKEVAGNVTKNPDLKAEGQDQKLKGDAQKAMGAVKTAIQSGVHRAGELLEKSSEDLKANGLKKIREAVKKTGEKIEHLGS